MYFTSLVDPFCSFQCPNIFHCVVTLDHCVAIGHHYYPTLSIQPSVYQCMHTLVRRGLITNEVHVHTRVLLHRMLTSWVDWYVYGNWDDGRFYPFTIAPQANYPSIEQERLVHVPDISTADSLLDLISVGCLVELSQALDERTFTHRTIPEDEQDEIDAASTRYRLFIRWYAARFVIVMNNEWINAHYIFKHRLVDFGATIVRYAHE
jgi:hypothetical protein